MEESVYKESGDGVWPFEDAPNTAVITLRQIVQEGKPVLYVSRDSEEGEWQFLDGNRVSASDALVVSLSAVVGLDPTLNELADLLPGWSAWRKSREEPWQRGMLA